MERGRRKEPEQQLVKRLYVTPHNFELIDSDSKTLEVRPNYPSTQKIGLGTRLIFISEKRECVRFVSRVAFYQSLVEIAENENLSRIDPGLSPEELLQEANKLFLPGTQKRGFLVFELAREMPEGNRSLKT